MPQPRMNSFLSLPASVVAEIERKLRFAYQLAGEEPNQSVLLTVSFSIESDEKCRVKGSKKMKIKQGDREWSSLGEIVDGQLEMPGMGVLSDYDPEESGQAGQSGHRDGATHRQAETAGRR